MFCQGLFSIIEQFFLIHESRPNHRERDEEFEKCPNGELLQALRMEVQRERETFRRNGQGRYHLS